jgi:hypothetical protein
MHKHIEIAGDTVVVRRLAEQMRELDGVVGLSLQRDSSLKPAGDVLSVHALNATCDDVLRIAAEPAHCGVVSIVLSESSALIDANRREQIAGDDDEALWEEMESQLRNHGRVSINYIALMLLGGALSGLAFVLDPVTQAITFVGASITCPGFEPLAKIGQGVVLRRRVMVLHGAWACLIGYASLIVAAAATYALLLGLGESSAEQLRSLDVVSALTSRSAHSLLPSVLASLAGGLMVASLRDTYVVGPLMILALIPAAGLVGAAGAAGELALAWRAGSRVLIDMACVTTLVALVMLVKQLTKHKRAILP